MFAFFDSFATGAGVAEGGVEAGVGFAVEVFEDGLVSLTNSAGASFAGGQKDAEEEDASGLGISQPAALGAGVAEIDFDFFSFLTGGEELLLPSPQKAARPPDGGVGLDGGGTTASSELDPQLAISTAEALAAALALPQGPVSEPMLNLLLLLSRPFFFPPMNPCNPLIAFDHELFGEVGEAELLPGPPLAAAYAMKSLSILNFSMSGVDARLLGLSLTVHGNLPVFRSARVPLGPPLLPLRWWWWILMGDVGELGEGETLSGLRLRAKNGSGPRRPPKRSP